MIDRERMSLEFCKRLPDELLALSVKCGIDALRLYQQRDSATYQLALHGIKELAPEDFWIMMRRRLNLAA
jgi:hypothetical protein